jgi:hypothetical protein
VSCVVLLAMDPLPALHPIVLRNISSPPFEYSPRGLTFKGHPRESIADLKQWLFPKRKNAAPPNKIKDWWLAQLHLHGFNVKASMRKEDLIEVLKLALSSGLDGPPRELLQLEQKLEREFLLQNEAAREKEYQTLSEEKRAEKYSERFLREKFSNRTKEETLLALELDSLGSGGRVHDAAATLGLHSESACGAQGRMWTIVGKNERDVQKRKSAIEREFHDWESEERAAKRRKVEQRRQELEAGGEGSFEDVQGEWSIQCPKMDKEYRADHRSMSIFFHKPSTRRYKRDEEGYPYHDSEDDEEGYAKDDSEDEAQGAEVYVSRILCANFKMGILEGTLRSRVENFPALSSSFPVPMVRFTWRGIETGEGEIQLDYEGDVNVGSFNFISKTQVKGVFESSYGKWPFTGCKVAKSPADTGDSWEDYSEEAHERARVGRWH